AVKGIAGISRLVGSLLQLKGGKVNIAESLNMATAMPVYVTNWGGGTSGIGAGGQFQKQINPQSNGKPTAPTPAQLAGVGAAAGISAAIVKIPQMMNELDEIKKNDNLTAKERGKAKGGAIGDASGSIVGATGGAVAGTLLGAIAGGAIAGTAIGTAVPGLGNAVGLLVGAGIGAAGFYFGGKAGRAAGGKIGESLASDDSVTNQVTRRRGKGAGYIPVSNLPPQITQADSIVTPQKVELGGQAVMDVNVNLSGISPTASVTMRDNTTPFRFDTGSRVEQRRNGR
ncbi:MAG: hypothetical protein LBH20_08450, partial [Treponema sp.]|nr:hypothetical protein [Treponema sp.]